MYAYIHTIYIYIYIRTYVRTYIHTYRHTHTPPRTHARTHARHIYAIYMQYTPQKVEGLMGCAREADQKRKRAERRLWLFFGGREGFGRSRSFGL